MQTDSVLVDTKDAEKVLVTKGDFEHALTYDVKPVSSLRDLSRWWLTLIVWLVISNRQFLSVFVSCIIAVSVAASGVSYFLYLSTVLWHQ